MKKRIPALLLAVVLLMSLALTACGPKADTGSSGAGLKQLTACLGPNPETLDPALNSSVDGANTILFAFDCLLAVDKDNKLIPAQAKSFDVSEDKLTYTFHLRDGLKWSDGSPLTAEDFVYSWKRIVDPELAAPYAETVLGMVKGYDEAAAGDLDALAVSAPDPLTFVVELARQTPYFDKLAAFAALAPVQKATVEANGDAWAVKPETYVSNGPFKITEWVDSSHIVLSKNENYWDTASIKLDSIKLLLIEDPNATLNAYQTGVAMMVKTLPAAEIPRLSKGEDYYLGSMMGTYYVCLNDKLPEFSDPRVRQALSLALDRKYIAETIMNQAMMPATGWVGPGIADWDGSDFISNANGGKPYIDIDNFESNLARAKELMAEAGYPEGKGFPTVHYAINEASFHKPVAEYVQQAWKELGVTAVVDVVEWKSFLPMRRAGDYQISRNGWVMDYNDPSNILELAYSTNGNNDAKYNNPAFDAAMDKAANEADPKTRFSYLHEAEDILMADMGVIPVAFYGQPYLQKANITGSWYSPYGYWYFQYADLA